MRDLEVWTSPSGRVRIVKRPQTETYGDGKGNWTEPRDVVYWTAEYCTSHAALGEAIWKNIPIYAGIERDVTLPAEILREILDAAFTTPSTPTPVRATTT